MTYTDSILFLTIGEGKAPLDESSKAATQILGQQDSRVAPAGSFEIISTLALKLGRRHRLDLRWV